MPALCCSWRIMRKRIFLAGLSILTIALLLVVLSKRTCPAKSMDSKLNFSFAYNLQLDNIPDNAKSIEIWIPVPSNNGVQKITDYRINSELPYNLYTDPEYGNRIAHFTTNGHIPKKLNVALNLDVVRFEQDGLNNNHQPESNDHPGNISRYLQPDILVPIDGQVKAEALQVVNDSLTPFQKIEAIYHHLFETMKYDKSGVGWGKGDALYACESRQGNCTDIHSLFIGMARSLGIPSRFIMGFPLPEEKTESAIAGYHCWAEFYIDGQGWVPVDISEAIKHPEKKEYFFGRLDPHRVAFTTGRDIKVNSGDTSHTLNYFIYPYVLVDGQPFTGASYNFSFAQKN